MREGHTHRENKQLFVSKSQNLLLENGGLVSKDLLILLFYKFKNGFWNPSIYLSQNLEIKGEE